MAKADLTAQRALELLHYDPSTGLLTRKVSLSASVMVGEVAGTPTPKGSIALNVDKKKYLAHRVIWLMQTGSWPTENIYHIDLDPSNNRWHNLGIGARSMSRQNKDRNDLSGQKFGSLTAIQRTGEKRWGVFMWECRCECGGSTVTASNTLKSGLVRSCGCLRTVSARLRQDFHGNRDTPAYRSWDSMIQRCTNPNVATYQRYGAKGIEVCERWASFQNFHADMGDRPDGTTLDRIDPYGNYEPVNCRWATILQQARNKREPITTFEQAEQVRTLYAQGMKPTEISKTLGIKRGSVSGIVYLGQVASPNDY